MQDLLGSRMRLNPPTGLRWRSSDQHNDSVPGKELFYKKLGFKQMSTAMVIFEDQREALERGFLTDAQVLALGELAHCQPHPAAPSNNSL
jgi:hypothetical protein